MSRTCFPDDQTQTYLQLETFADKRETHHMVKAGTLAIAIPGPRGTRDTNK